MEAQLRILPLLPVLKAKLPVILKPVLERAEKESLEEICTDNDSFEQRLTNDAEQINQLTGGIFKGIINGIIIGVVVGFVLFKVVK